jgi:hypothetical protein
MNPKTRTFTEAVDARLINEVKNNPTSHFSKTELAERFKPKKLVPLTALGGVLLHAAALQDAMDCYQEEKLLEHYLHNIPPFHTRRTLDQSYYWTLKTTKRRDRDQVVYRGTAPKKGYFCKCEKALGNPDRKAAEEAEKSLKNNEESPSKKKKVGCEHEQANSRKVARVIMVDQLWLWILNGSE